MDRILSAFLTRQAEDAAALSASSDLVAVRPVEGEPSNRFLCEFRCKGLVGTATDITEAEQFVVGIWFPSTYLREVDPLRIVTMLEPRNIWHPNVRAPFLCLGHMPPGTGLVSIVHQVFEIITYQRVTMREDDALNPIACGWTRQNRHLLPIDPRPLRRRRRRLDIEIEPALAENGR